MKKIIEEKIKVYSSELSKIHERSNTLMTELKMLELQANYISGKIDGLKEVLQEPPSVEIPATPEF